MTESIEQSIISGAKSGDAWASPAGILSETVATGQDVEIGASAKITYQTLVRKLTTRKRRKMVYD